MIKIFMEYKIDPDCYDDYMQVLDRVKEDMGKQGVLNYQCFEGADQPYLYVEMFDVADMEAYLAIKKLRCEDDQWISPFVPGGKEKIHLWAFKEIHPC